MTCKNRVSVKVFFFKDINYSSNYSMDKFVSVSETREKDFFLFIQWLGSDPFEIKWCLKDRTDTQTKYKERGRCDQLWDGACTGYWPTTERSMLSRKRAMKTMTRTRLRDWRHLLIHPDTLLRETTSFTVMLSHPDLQINSKQRN